MRSVLIGIFIVFFLTMFLVTVRASLTQNMFQAGAQLMSNAWFRATLVDAYLGFMTFYVWVFYKESSSLRRVVWFVLIMTLGNIAMSIYMLIRLAALRPSEGWRELLLPQER